MQSLSSSWSKEIQTAETLYATRDIKFQEEYRRPLLSAMGLKDGIRILDVGCGPGLLVHRLGTLLKQSNIFGIDHDADFIAFARMKTKPQTNICTFLVGDTLSLPFPDNSFDAVTSHTILGRKIFP
ncbi:methyltransferase domain-containing protein [Methanofollis formosanus]|uniref:Methyltransferase domain-containing protein n=1 Tax=Methanofollis formosanus TaxID=299308 RepID=A0A8G1A1U7_9EURY|nr:class I SAM-dependent methyltransferase [Methanofollis formosanus]QYZ78873.1 methyltransferase domain-containing protein [Methanofollis formosanus]